ncbi:MAG: type I-C CRISPR-associated protein Cas8c/Csd1 [Limisphaerales bacterium]
MLQALIAYAEREGLGDPDFETVGVRWLISLTADGRLAGEPIPLADNPGDKKPRPKRLVRPKSDPDFVSHGRSYFLCDSLERSAVFVDDDAKREKRRVNQEYFVGLLEESAKDCPTESNRLRVLATFLRDETRLADLHSKLATAKAKTSDNAAFSVGGHDLLASNELKLWWKKRHQRQRDDQEKIESVCLATGRFGPICRTAGFVKLLGEDTKLISFNKECPAFESLGLSQAANAPVGVAAEGNFRSALNALIEKSRGQGLVFSNTVHLHWSREALAEDPIDLLTTADPEPVAALLKSVQAGQRHVGLDANAYYALSLSGNGARIVVRDWLESTVPEVERNIAHWFADLAVVHPDGMSTRRDFKFGALLYGMVRAELAELSPQIPTQLLHAALRGRKTPLPQSALAAALRRQQLDQDNKLNPARLALIKACLLRSANLSPPDSQPSTPAMSESLNPESCDAAYLCGRLFAVFVELQEAALGQVGAGVAERFYASASVTPALVMGRLFRNAQFHASKAEGLGGWRKGKAINAQKDFEEISCALGDKFPATLDLESQGRFALGYYHQKADYRRRTAERKEQQAAEAANA